MNPPGLEQVAQTQGLVKAGPVELVAAVFMLAFIWVLFLYLRAKDRHLMNVSQLEKDYRLELKEMEKANALSLAELNKERLAQAIRIETTLAKFLEYIDEVSRRQKEEEARRRSREQRKPRSEGGDSGPATGT